MLGSSETEGLDLDVTLQIQKTGLARRLFCLYSRLVGSLRMEEAYTDPNVCCSLELELPGGWKSPKLMFMAFFMLVGS